MNPAKVANALNTISVAFGELAEALIEQPGPVAASPSASSPLAATPAGSPVPADTFDPQASASFAERSPFEDETVTWEAPDNLDEGAEAMCPKHRKPYLPSQFKEGTFYCPADSDDPAWRNTKGKCRISPKNAAEYLRIRAAA